ncbi:hypothetical protein CTRI78_v003333 [Colletotrichum trifolii]|uniref:DUF7598 domain-containing protein n=1 Tax=Colletotrichum trifolii TaxID=5466 RepID=A0A4R8RJL0_COLTR|nr:hypothetical protein CTRI78_v003333 [Colletotrichum trifolii]
MFNLSENSRLRGSGHMLLNVLRSFNVIGLLAVCASTWVMIVMSILKHHFAFFDSASHFFTFCIAIFLMFSELNLFRGYFERNWPVLSCEHGLSWLGISMVVMGCQVLGNITEDTYSQETIGLPLWRLILASGILVITFGFFNIICSIVFRDGSGINARNIRSDGTLASAKNSFVDGYSVRSNSIRSNPVVQQPVYEEKRFKRLTQKLTPWTKSRSGSVNPRPAISHPMPPAGVERGNDVSQTDCSYPHTDNNFDEDRRSPIMPQVARPPTALHPMNAHHSRFSKYSEVSGMDRF